MSGLRLDDLRACLEGMVPSELATCGADGMPNVTAISQVEYVDAEHVALSYQFFNKTRRNILANPQATVDVIDPVTTRQYQLALLYVRTEYEGPLFERMKARLAGIASFFQMQGVFRLLGADVYRVLAIEAVPMEGLPPLPPRQDLLAGLRAANAAIAQATDLESLIDGTLDALVKGFGIPQVMLLLADEMGRRLYTLASRGYETSGVGAEIRYGEGVIGVAAEQRVPIRIGFKSTEYSYGRAIREQAEQSGLLDVARASVPFPGLPDSYSQLAVPLVAAGELMGVLYVESPQFLRFWHADEDALASLGSSLALSLRMLQHTAAQALAAPVPAPQSDVEPLQVRRYAPNDSIFLGEEYLIKGVAGAILWALLNDYHSAGRTDFSNRELRLDSRLPLPDLCDNLEARLILLRRRLEERTAALAIEKTARGQFRLAVRVPLRLQDMSA
ncbi:GAF domain-containing protein [Niveibacterium sp. SC-1]|uniref:GAF domain-containing protein n=1 Tax=Niveibacterium sp. SC-1 TaxID=3135646 RepID=UPI00311D3740